MIIHVKAKTFMQNRNLFIQSIIRGPNRNRTFVYNINYNGDNITITMTYFDFCEQ